MVLYYATNLLLIPAIPAFIIRRFDVRKWPLIRLSMSSVVTASTSALFIVVGACFFLNAELRDTSPTAVTSFLSFTASYLFWYWRSIIKELADDAGGHTPPEPSES